MGSGVIYYEYEKREKFKDHDMKADAELGTIKIRRYRYPSTKIAQTKSKHESGVIQGPIHARTAFWPSKGVSQAANHALTKLQHGQGMNFTCGPRHHQVMTRAQLGSIPTSTP
ncbi:hypothetical protein PIB30_048907, partial [Stylosanthes scabra]|nr:hypothetical protein [Stylosanthes scabra]